MVGKTFVEYSFGETKWLIVYCIHQVISHFCSFVYAVPDSGNAQLSMPGIDSSFAIDRMFVFPQIYTLKS